VSKTRIVHLTEGGEGFDFLGFHHRLVRGRGLRARHLHGFLGVGWSHARPSTRKPSSAVENACTERARKCVGLCGAPSPKRLQRI
jgi:hypothetical protein